MKTTQSKSVAVVLILSLVLGLCAGCNEGNSGLQLNPIYTQSLTGAIIGGIVGYQSEEPGEGAAVGAALFGVGELLHQIDREHREKEHRHKDGCAEQVVVEIHNDNGSMTPVKLKRDGCAYIGPKGERYEQLPTEEQLKPIYGLK